jgi:hypothetical protein
VRTPSDGRHGSVSRQVSSHPVRAWAERCGILEKLMRIVFFGHDHGLLFVIARIDSRRRDLVDDFSGKYTQIIERNIYINLLYVNQCMRSQILTVYGSFSIRDIVTIVTIVTILIVG